MNLAVDEIGEHLLGRQLVIAGRIGLQLLDGECIADDMGMIDDRVTHIDMDDISHQLLPVVPHDRIAVEGHTGVEGVVYQRVADSLNIPSEGPHMMKGMDLTVHRIGINVEGDNLERVGMHKERVALRVIDGHSTIGTQGKARVLIVLTIVARQLIAVDGINIDHIEERLAEPHPTVVIDTIAHEHLTVIIKYRTVHESGTLELRVVVALLGVDMIVARGDVGGANDVGHGVVSVVIKSIGGKEEVRVLHLHVVVEHRHLRLRVVLSPVRGESGLAVNHLAPLEEIGIVVETVKVEAVGIERGLAVFEYDIITGPGHLFVAVVISVVADQ